MRPRTALIALLAALTAPATAVATATPPTPPPPSAEPAGPTTESSPPTTAIEWTGVAGMATDAVQVVEFGRSVEDRPLVAVERGTPGGAVVLVIGVIHGDESDGVAILERLATAPVPEGVDLWLIESINPDGQAVPQRGNANGVDLNRNFPHEWGPIGGPGDGQYAGTGPASEPETQALVGMVTLLQPELTLWYHQDLFRLSPGSGFEGELKARYAELTGLPILDITGGTYTGVAATWVRRTIDAPSFIVELGEDLPPGDADRHAAAVVDLAEIVAAQR
ncbi:MAG: M14 family zinc carboxypeptidase [Desertimonas sp.]